MGRPCAASRLLAMEIRAHPALILQPIAGVEEPGNDRHAQRKKAKRDGHAQSDMDVGDIEKAPAEAGDQ
jgi:hypothetical protein